MLKFVTPKLVIRNRSAKSLNLFGMATIKQNKPVDLFKVCPNLSESKVIDELRPPSGQLYKEVHVNKNLEILECVLNSFHGYSISPDQLNIVGEGYEGQVIAISEDHEQFRWAFHNEEDRLFLEPPLVKKGDNVFLPKADDSTNGYLAKEDWVLFKGKSQGIRIWQYQDFKGPIKSALEISSFENGASVGTLSFNENYIVNGSAVIVDLDKNNKPPLSDKSFLKMFSKENEVQVQQHVGKTVILNQEPDATSNCRLYFLIVLPYNVDVPADYEAPPKFVRDQRIELMDSIDIDVMGSKTVRGQKNFTNQITVKDAVGVNVDTPAAPLDVGGLIKAEEIKLTKTPSSHYVLTSNSLGEAKWATSPAVAPIPPANNYDGQLWVKIPEYETFIYDGGRKKWLGLNSFCISGSKNSTSSENIYLHIGDNIPMNINSTVLPYDATLVSLIASSETVQNWTAEVHLKGSLVDGALLPIMSSDNGFNHNLNVDFRAGDKIELFVSGRGISMPHIMAIFRRKV